VKLTKEAKEVLADRLREGRQQKSNLSENYHNTVRKSASEKQNKGNSMSLRKQQEEIAVLAD